MYIQAMRQPKFSGVHSLSTGWKDDRRKILFFVWELPDGAYAVQELDSALQPLAAAERISTRAFRKNFCLEPEVLAMPMANPDPALWQPSGKVAQQPLAAVQAPATTQTQASSPATPPLQAAREAARQAQSARGAAARRLVAPQPAATQPSDTPYAATPQAHAAARLTVRTAGPTAAGPDVRVARQTAPPTLFEPGATASAGQAFDLQRAHLARLTEDNLRETFRQTLLRLKRPKERQAALAALEQLAQTNENITPGHKHMFRDFGVRLRQNALPDLALLFSRKAVELAPDDDHAHFNLARILCLLGRYDEAASHVRTAIHMDAQEPVYIRMLAHIRKEKLQHKGSAAPSTPH